MELRVMTNWPVVTSAKDLTAAAPSLRSCMPQPGNGQRDATDDRHNPAIATANS